MPLEGLLLSSADPSNPNAQFEFRKRPYLRSFLHHISQFYEIVLVCDYPDPIPFDMVVLQLDPFNQYFAYVLYQDSLISLDDARKLAKRRADLGISYSTLFDDHIQREKDKAISQRLESGDYEEEKRLNQERIKIRAKQVPKDHPKRHAVLESIENLPENKFDHTDRPLIKDLSRFNRDLSKVVVLETLPRSVPLHPENVIVVSDFHGDHMDKSLRPLKDFLVALAYHNIKDVREIIYSHHGRVLDQYMEKHEFLQWCYNQLVSDEYEEIRIGRLIYPRVWEPLPDSELTAGLAIYRHWGGYSFDWDAVPGEVTLKQLIENRVSSSNPLDLLRRGISEHIIDEHQSGLSSNIAKNLEFLYNSTISKNLDA